MKTAKEVNQELGGRPKSSKSIRVNVYLSLLEYESLKAFCDKNSIKMSEALRWGFKKLKHTNDTTCQ